MNNTDTTTNSLFMALKPNKKIYEDFIYYVEHINNYHQNLTKIDNDIQAHELVYVHKDLRLLWVKENSKKFRRYLNSLKVCYIIYKKDYTSEDNYMSYDTFKRVIQEYTEYNNFILKCIHN